MSTTTRYSFADISNAGSHDGPLTDKQKEMITAELERHTCDQHLSVWIFRNYKAALSQNCCGPLYWE